MVKGNSVSNTGEIGYEPYSEVMASSIAKYLGLGHVGYSLMDAATFPEVVVTGVGHVSVCANFVPNGWRTVSLDRYLYAKLLYEPKDYLQSYAKFLPVEPLYKLLVFDALIGNEDRHERNIDILLGSNGEEQLAPIFDNGASLLAWRSDKELLLAPSVGRLDKAKPLRSTHSKQINLVPIGLFPRVDLNQLQSGIVGAIEPMRSFIPERRFNAILAYLNWRVKYLDKVMG
ncbi:MAG: hypothetical protein WD469_00810 [Paenibacillaceae bacterium]